MTTSSCPLVSVVTPVYNGEQHLRECLESVLRQTYPHWDYTLVNNCSTDGTLRIAEEYAARDPRIRIRTNPAFVRVIENYNNAVAQRSPHSKYCKVIAADDWMYPECLERMVQFCEDHPTVAVVGSYQLYGTEVAWQGLPHEKSLLSGREACRIELLGGPYVFGTPSTVMYRSALIGDGRFFDESNLHADTEACFRLLEHHDFGFVHQVLTFRRMEAGSLTAFSKRFNTYSPSLLHLLLKHGSKYLAPEEHTRRFEQVLDHYYYYLAKQLLIRRERKFWDYHMGKLSDLGHPFSRVRLAAAVLRVGGNLLLNPKNTVEWAVRRASTKEALLTTTPASGRSR